MGLDGALGIGEMRARMRSSSDSGSALSMSPPTLSLISFQPAHRMLTATIAAKAGSRMAQPVAVASSTPTSTPADETTSVSR